MTSRILLLLAAAALAAPRPAAAAEAPRQIGGRLELFVDRYLIETLDGAELRLGQPQPREVVLRFDLPWEVPFSGAHTVLKDGDLYRLYYRGGNTDAHGEYDEGAEVTCYAESRDGIHWVKPILNLYEYRGSRANNLILPPQNERRVSHNFAPFIDTRPGVPPEERYKAVGGTRKHGLFRLVSGDGIHWRLFSTEPIFHGYALDTLNVAQWSPAEGVYVAFIRPGGTPFRAVARAVSKDFVTWSKPKLMDMGDTPPEHIYTNATHPYFRAPHLLIALPFRFQPERAVLSRSEHNALRTHYTQRVGISDAVLLTSRGGHTYDRTFMESFIRPGLERGAWAARSTLPGLGVVPTGPGEMSIYITTHHTMTDYHMRRYTLRTDGFASVNAPFTGGMLLTKPLVFTGRRLVVNYSTSAIGDLRVELADGEGRPLPGFTFADCDEIVGDEISRTVSWGARTDVAALAGRPVRLRVAMKDADLYSIQFCE
ncbi:MAG: hypothetical protein JNG83_15075 [Opitutaceae bacterium]|nr:hypothetical protein [Opitutaceae bacterium]